MHVVNSTGQRMRPRLRQSKPKGRGKRSLTAARELAAADSGAESLGVSDAELPSGNRPPLAVAGDAPSVVADRAAKFPNKSTNEQTDLLFKVLYPAVRCAFQ